MKLSLGLKILSGAALLTLTGCLGMGQDEGAETRASNAEKIKFVNATSGVLAKAAVVQQAPGAGQGPQIDWAALGCPKLGGLMKDLTDWTTNQSGATPQSLVEFLKCFGLSPQPTQEELAKIDNLNPKELLDCICGGSGLSDLLNGSGYKWTAFQTETSAAGKVFTPSTSAAGNASTTSNSAAGNGFTVSTSAAGNAFTTP